MATAATGRGGTGPGGQGSPRAWDFAVLQRLPMLLDNVDICNASRVCKSWHAALGRDAKAPVNLNLEGRPGIAKRLGAYLSAFPAKRVRSLSLRFCPDFCDAEVSCLGRLAAHGLEALNLDYCQKVSDKGVAEVARLFPRLRRLSLFWMPWLRGGIARPLSGLCHLRTLNLSGVTHLTDADMAKIVKGVGRGLLSLDLTRNKNVGPATLRAVGLACAQLVTLKLYACERYADADLRLVARGCSQLQHLDLCGAKRLTDEGVRAIANGCRCLGTLNLMWCVNVTDASLNTLARRCRRLSWLSLHGLKKVSARGLEALGKGCPYLTTVDVNGVCLVQDRSLSAVQRLIPSVYNLVPL